MTTDKLIEDMIQQKQLNAPRVTVDQVHAEIVHTVFFTAHEGMVGEAVMAGVQVTRDIPALRLLTFCVLVLKNGFTVTGESACASPENFDAGIGKEIAYRNAVAKVWPLLGYELRTRLTQEGNA